MNFKKYFSGAELSKKINYSFDKLDPTDQNTKIKKTIVLCKGTYYKCKWIHTIDPSKKKPNMMIWLQTSNWSDYLQQTTLHWHPHANWSAWF